MDEIEENLRSLKSELPEARRDLSADEIIALISQVGGPKTTWNLIKASKELPLKRIPFVFSSIDTQSVVDVLANIKKVKELLQEAEAKNLKYTKK